MPSIKFRRGKDFGADMAVYMEQIGDELRDDPDHSRLIRNLIRCVREEITPRQREVLFLYYVKNIRQKEIAAQLGVERSTVSRTIKRGEDRLRRCLRYGAERYLRATQE